MLEVKLAFGINLNGQIQINSHPISNKLKNNLDKIQQTILNKIESNKLQNYKYFILSILSLNLISF